MRKHLFFWVLFIIVAMLASCHKKETTNASSSVTTDMSSSNVVDEEDTTLMEFLTWQDQIVWEIEETRKDLPIVIDEMTQLISLSYDFGSSNTITYTYEVATDETDMGLFLSEQQQEELKQMTIDGLISDDDSEFLQQMAADDVHVAYVYLNRNSKTLLSFDVRLRDFVNPIKIR